jgi:acetylornithine deacetylase/succinyl-diaminopimelate desuccinylase-like protein
MSQIEAVLQRIDRDLDASLERLFTLLRIQSVSTDPAFKDSCRAAADYVAADLKSIGFAAEVRPTQGHPIVIGKSSDARSGNGNANGKPRVLFYGPIRRSSRGWKRYRTDARSSSPAAPATIRVRP